MNDGSKVKLRGQGKGHIQSMESARVGKEQVKTVGANATGGTMTAGIKGKKPIETERHRTFHGHAAKSRTSAGN